VTFDFVESESDPLYHNYRLHREPNEHTKKRGLAFLKWLKDRPEQEVVVVSHHAFLRQLFKDSIVEVDELDHNKIIVSNPHFDNCEMRSFVVDF
jgi:broad specificity phosphatase PhoE